MAAVSAAPPQLPGLTYLEPIGTGGFADVHLYQQSLPARRVAVKVLREATDAAGMEQFHAEANVMAQLAGHPSIVPIYQADVSADGRAYLVMEFCPPPHLADRYRSERLPVPEVLELAVKIASAVETAHRVGILHRDIKPHNILTSVYGTPLLTDFGIAAAAAEGDAGGYGLSVPWSPPEAFDDQGPLDVRSDVFSLAATVYSLLAGRSPFEVPGAANDSATLIHRIERQAPARILRADVPDSLNDLLLRGLAKRLDERPASAMAFARAVQEVQIEMHLPPTRLEVLDASTSGQAVASGVDDERTRVRPVSIIVPEEMAERGTRLRPRQVTQVDDRTRTRVRPDAPVDTARRPLEVRPERTPAPSALEPAPAALEGPEAPAAVPPAEEAGRSSRRPLVLGAIAAGVIAVAAAAGIMLGTDPPAPDPRVTTPPPRGDEVISGGPVAPVDLKWKRVGDTIRFSWTNPAPREGDSYSVATGQRLQRLEDGQTVQRPRLEVRAPAGQQVCIQVRTMNAGAVSRELEECVEAER